MASERVAEAFAFVGLACSPPGSSTDLLCLWPHHGCHRSLWPNSPAVPICTEKWCLGVGLPSAIPLRPASAAGRLNVPGLHLRGWHSQLKLLTLDVYCIFLKKYLFVNSVYVLIFFFEALLNRFKEYCTFLK